MSNGSLAVVQEWLTAVNHGNSHRAGQLSADQLEISGPRGSMRGRGGLSEWMARAGFSAEPVHWFCGADGSVVVEQVARWADPATGAGQGSAVVASQFAVDGSCVTRYARHNELRQALGAAGLDDSDEVTREQR